MIKFAHLADIHLGAWRYPELQQLNLEAFRQAIDICLKEKVNFILIAGDLFDVAVPSIDILKEAVSEFKKLKDAGIACYIVPGSHDYSVTGRTFIEVLERGGFCKNVANFIEENEKIFLNFFIDDKNKVVFSGIPGKKTNLELELFKKLEKEFPKKYEDMLKIFVFHTTLTESKQIETMPSISISELPPGFDYYAAGHLHLVDIKRKGDALVIYPGPLFPNNIEEIEKLKSGSFFIVNYDPLTKEFQTEKKELKFKDVITLEIDVNDLSVEEANFKILEELSRQDLKDKIVILKIFGCLSSGKTSDINFDVIKEKTKESYLLLKNTNKLTTKELNIDVKAENKSIEEIEKEFIEKYKEQIPDEFKNYSQFILPLIEHANFEKNEEEKKQDFEKRVIESISKILNISLE
ncbi:MAG: DNA repair exonuclease [Candidatus Pacearchaeota archaeon]